MNLEFYSFNYCTTHSDKVILHNPSQGVTIPSQRRYVYYFGYALKYSLRYSIKTLWLRKFIFKGIPSFSSGGGCCESTFCAVQVFVACMNQVILYIPVTGVVVAYLYYVYIIVYTVSTYLLYILTSYIPVYRYWLLVN